MLNRNQLFVGERKNKQNLYKAKQGMIWELTSVISLDDTIDRKNKGAKNRDDRARMESGATEGKRKPLHLYNSQ